MRTAWEILSPCGFEAVWNGGTSVEAVTVRADPGAAAHQMPVSLFGQGVLTFHVEGIFRTPPGWNLWIGGSPNRPKDGIAPLSGVVESDWSPYTFTMNWRFTRPHTPIRFEALQPFCFIFPVQCAALEAFAPRLAPIDADGALAGSYAEWRRARDASHERVRREPPKAPADRWQKHYYRGVDVAGQAHRRPSGEAPAKALRSVAGRERSGTAIRGFDSGVARSRRSQGARPAASFRARRLIPTA